MDREKALSLGVPVQDVFDALQTTMGALYVNDFNTPARAAYRRVGFTEAGQLMSVLF